ncbi:unnamed protein product [Cercopithifilaria johnstoni]|nr:unnamed protein product [Cercopithifilaria johnstoni]
MTEIITKEELSTFASSELEDSNKDEITDFSSFVTENSTVNKTTNEFVFTVMAENDNISETKEEVSTISNTHELSATTDLPEKNVSEIESSSKKHFEIVGVGSSYLSALINSSTTGLQNTTTFTSYLSSQSHCKFNNWCNNGWEFFRGRCYAQYPFWIGLSNDGNGWKWPDNTKLRYQLWGKNEPNIMYSCVFAETEKNGKYWYTNDCNRTITHNDIVGYVCQQ